MSYRPPPFFDTEVWPVLITTCIKRSHGTPCAQSACCAHRCRHTHNLKQNVIIKENSHTRCCNSPDLNHIYLAFAHKTVQSEILVSLTSSYEEGEAITKAPSTEKRLLLFFLRAAFKFGRRVHFALRRKMLKPPIARLSAI